MAIPRRPRAASRPARLAGAAGVEVHNVRVLARAGLLRPAPPLVLLRVVSAIVRWGMTPAAGYAGAAARYGGETALVDDEGDLTFLEIHRRTNALANSLWDRGIREGSRVAVMCRNHRGFVDATVALSKLGAHCLFLNTGFAAPQVADVLKDETITAILHDAEFSGLLEGVAGSRARYVFGTPGASGDLDAMIADGRQARPPVPSRPGRVVILTSGTTGTPKGAGRTPPRGIGAAAAVLSRIPLRARDRVLIAAPLFHSWGLAHFELGLLLNSTFILQRRFDPERTLEAIERHRPRVLVAVPVMLQRIMALPKATRKRYDHSSLEVVAVSGSNLPGDLALEFMDEFGDIIHNLYGSTEIGWATIATPAELRASPGTAGRPPKGTVVRLFDDADREVEAGAPGRIFVGNGFEFEGYTTGGGKPVIQGLMGTGDVGHFDANGLLMVDGRDDEMIVSGGENVFPREVEDILSQHPGVADVAVVGVADREFGQRLRAFVVRRPGSDVDEATLREHVRANLARFKVPRDIRFLDALPRNSTGKVLKRELVTDDGGSEEGSELENVEKVRGRKPKGNGRKP